MRARLILIAGALTATPLAAQRADSAAFVTVLGTDTLAVERWIRSADRVDAEVVVRSPRTTLRRGTLYLTDGGAMERWEERWLDPEHPAAEPRRVEIVEPVAGGSWVRRITEGDSVREASLNAPPDALPWADLVHWPFDLAVGRLPDRGAFQMAFLAGQRPLVMTLERTASGEVTITHPLRGPTLARLDPAGRIASLDAARTTRKVVVTRVPWADVQGRAVAWAAADRAGQGVGELSGRGGGEASFGGASIRLDFGTPLLRGRQVFGTVVPWGQLWRTGANRATHFATSAPLVLDGTLQLPAGEYTLFSIPQQDGGWLIVSRQTGQAGTAYDSAQDFGRVRLRRREVAGPRERFDIRVEETGHRHAELVIAWDRSEFYVPMRLR
jgi:hypothetical protein